MAVTGTAETTYNICLIWRPSPRNMLGPLGAYTPEGYHFATILVSLLPSRPCRMTVARSLRREVPVLTSCFRERKRVCNDPPFCLIKLEDIEPSLCARFRPLAPQWLRQHGQIESVFGYSCGYNRARGLSRPCGYRERSD